MDISELEEGAMLLSAYSDGRRGERVGSDKKQLVRSVPAEERQNHNKVERHFFFFLFTGRLTLWQWFCSKYSKKLGHTLLAQPLAKIPSEGLDTVDNTPGTSM